MDEPPRHDPPVLLGYVGVVLIAGGFGILVDARPDADPLATAAVLLVTGSALLGVDLLARIRRRDG